MKLIRVRPKINWAAISGVDRNPELVQRYLYDMFYNITCITVYQSDTSQDMSTEYNTPNPQSHRTDTKYNTIPILLQVHFCKESHSPKYKHDEKLWKLWKVTRTNFVVGKHQSEKWTGA